MDKRPVGPLIAAVYGALVALSIGYGLCFFLIRVGIANVTSPGVAINDWDGALARAGLNLCAAQHAVLIGSGRVGDAMQQASASAEVVLPLSLWAIIPAAALFVSGYAAGRLRGGCSRLGILVPAILGGIFYAGILAALSRWFVAPIDAATLPSVGGFEFAPPSFSFHPLSSSALITGCIFGVVFTFMGGHFAAHESARGQVFSRWWVCAKSVLPLVVFVQLVIAVAAQGWLVSKTGPENPEGPAGRGIVRLHPTIAGIAYGLLNGATLKASVTSEGSLVGGEKKPLAASVNLYNGLETHSGGENNVRQLPWQVYGGAALVALLAFASGALSVRWGSRDGSLPTALRIGIIHAAYLGFTMFTCAVAWKSTVNAGQFKAASSVFIGLVYEPAMLCSFIGVSAVAFAGAFWTSKKYASGRTGFPTL